MKDSKTQDLPSNNLSVPALITIIKDLLTCDCYDMKSGECCPHIEAARATISKLGLQVGDVVYYEKSQIKTIRQVAGGVFDHQIVLLNDMDYWVDASKCIWLRDPSLKT